MEDAKAETLKILGITEDQVNRGEPILIELHPSEVYALIIFMCYAGLNYERECPKLFPFVGATIKHFKDRFYFDADRIPNGSVDMERLLASVSLLMITYLKEEDNY